MIERAIRWWRKRHAPPHANAFLADHQRIRRTGPVSHPDTGRLWTDEDMRAAFEAGAASERWLPAVSPGRLAHTIEIAIVEHTGHHPMRRHIAGMGWLWPIIADAILADAKTAVGQ